jgi:2-polyprenyl-3-methyl-5-hydroxy-6-metoxy-1,4-benzoquinol methylase
MTPALAGHFSALTLIEGSKQFSEELARAFPQATVVNALFEDVQLDTQFDTIVLGHVLEHVAQPRALLRRVRGWLAPGGVAVTCVPNARSLHRQAAVLMGLLNEEHELNDTDRHHGHRRVYDPESLRAEVLGAGLGLEAFGGFWLKPLANGQIDATWTPEMLSAFMSLGERYPDIAAEIYVVATPSPSG